MALVTEPFKLGWTRELVLRNTFEEYTKSGNRKQAIPGDIYYFSPDGKKLRSMPQIIEHLEKTGSPLTRENFTFFKKPIAKPPYERVRHAGRACIVPNLKKQKRKRLNSDSEDIHDDDEPLDKPEIVIERDSDGTVRPLVITPSPKKNKRTGGTPKFKITPKRTPTVQKRGRPPLSPSKSVSMIIIPKKEQQDLETTEVVHVKPRVLTAEDVLASPLITDEMLTKDNEMSTNSQAENVTWADNGFVWKQDGFPIAKKHKPTARKSTTQKIFRSPFRSKITSQVGFEALCSLNCPGQENIPPNLHCTVCLCLFHPQCVNFQSDSDKGFICLRCVDPSIPEAVNGGKVKSKTPSTLTAMLSKPPINTQTTSTFNDVKIKEEPIDYDEMDKSTTYSSLMDAIMPITKIPDSVVTTTTAILPNSTTAGLTPDLSSKSRTDVKGETLGSLRSVLDKRTTVPEIPNLPNFLTVSSVANVPNFQSLNFATSPFAPRTKLPFTNISAGPASTHLYNAALLPMLKTAQNLPVSRNINVPTSAPPLLANFSKNIPSVTIPLSLPTVVSPTVSVASSRINSTYDVSQTVTRSSSPSMVITSAVSLMPPKLIAAPTSHTSTTPVSASTVTGLSNGIQPQSQKNGQKEPKSGQLLTLPLAVTKRLNLNQPLALKINNMQVTVPPSSFLHTSDGLRVFLPRNTFPVLSGETAKLSVTVTNDKSSPLIGGVSVNVNTNTSSVKADKSTIPNPPELSTSKISHEKSKQCKIRPWKSGVVNPGMCFMKRLFGGFDCLLQIFQYLNLKDLTRAGMVCRTWRNISLNPTLWKEVKLKGINVPDWELFVRFLKSRSADSLNLCGLLHCDNPNRTWHQLVAVIHEFVNIKKIHFDLVPALVLHSICPKIPQLEVLTARWISDLRFSDSNDDQVWSIPTKLDLAKFSALSDLQELRVRGVAGLTLPFSNGPSELEALKNLKVLSLTSLKDLGYNEFGFLIKLNQLESLELGDCTSWSSETYFQLGSLCNLRSLRLECGGELPDVGLSDALQNMKKLENLELIMYAIPDTLAAALEQLVNLISLTVWPDTFNYSAATVNSNALTVVSKLINLERLEWGILSNKNSSIILDNESNDSHGSMDQSENAVMIPFLPSTFEEEDSQESQNSELMTEYVFVHQFREKLSKLLPDTKIKVFSAKMLSARDELSQHLNN